MNLLQSLHNPSHRIGFHYFPDSLHYRESDLNKWLPELIALGARWLVLTSSTARAIPEFFIRKVVEAGIEPIIQFSEDPIFQSVDTRLLSPLMNSYARWGCKVIQFFDQPNSRSSWGKETQSNTNPVDRFLDSWLPLANLTVQSGMLPLMPSLEPGGTYWDTAFFLATLQRIRQRQQKDILENIILCANGWTFGHSLNWGAGGPRRWSLARPYFTPTGSEDQQGFRTYEWYQTIAEVVLGRVYPVIILQAGLSANPNTHIPEENYYQQQANNCLSIAHLASGQPSLDPQNPGSLLEPLPSSVLACAFYCLSASGSSPHLPHAWYPMDGINTPAAQALKTFHANNQSKESMLKKKKTADGSNHTVSDETQTIQHYLLIPSFDWGVSDYHLEAIRPFIKKYRPTIGFSLTEAAKARRVTVINDANTFPEELLHQLHQSGCQVDWINSESGTELATLLLQR